MIIVAIVFWLSVGLIVYAHAGYPVLLGLLAAVRDHGPGARRRARPAPDDQLPAVSVIVAAYAEQDVIAERVANIRALDYPDTADRGDRGLRRFCGRDRLAGARGGGGRRARATARGKDPRPGRRRRASQRRDRGVLGRERDLGAGRAPAPRGAVQRCARRLRVRRGTARGCRDGVKPGGPVLALRARAARARVARQIGHRRQRRDLRHPPRVLPGGRPDHGPRPVVPVQHGQARLAGARRPRGPGEREDGPDARGRVRPQAPHDEPHVADRHTRRDALPSWLRRRRTRS